MIAIVSTYTAIAIPVHFHHRLCDKRFPDATYLPEKSPLVEIPAS